MLIADSLNFTEIDIPDVQNPDTNPMKLVGNANAKTVAGSLISQVVHSDAETLTGIAAAPDSKRHKNRVQRNRISVPYLLSNFIHYSELLSYAPKMNWGNGGVT